MSRNFDREGGCAWRVEFIQPAIPDDDRCVMLYGPSGEIVGPLTMQLAEAWIDHFDFVRCEKMQREQETAAADVRT